ncbi:MAG: GNAT family N-acetyltransferase [Campylobacteraceae bacterium]|nr:GNAT family N-acetyltransferase [Campylobacteraceae bacterium]
MKKSDLKSASLVHKENFTRQNFSYEYLECSFNSYPKSLIYIVEDNENIIAYIIWTQKSGFRKEVVLELEQIAVLKNKQANNVGTELIISSLKLVKNVLLKTQSRIKHIIVSTRDDNYVKKLYKKVLNVKVETVIKDLYSADEVIMIAKDISDC